MIGYARVSSKAQCVDLQVRALRQAGCDKIMVDKSPGADVRRRGLQRALRVSREGDTLAVWRLDRLGRNTVDLLGTTELLRYRGVDLMVLEGPGKMAQLDTPEGKFIIGVLGCFAELERDLIGARSRAGRKASLERRKAMAPTQKLGECKCDCE